MSSRKTTVLLLIAGLGALTWASAQSIRTDLFDAKKSQQELEIMKGILWTTISFVRQEHDPDKESGRSRSRVGLLGSSFPFEDSGISAYYLPGQGATFILPVSSGLMGIDEERLVAEIEAVSAAEIEAKLEETKVALAAEAQELAKTKAKQSAGVAPPAPPQAPAPPPAPRIDREVIRKRVGEYQQQMKERYAQAQERRKKLIDSIEDLKGYLVDALANHGDSLTHVKQAEYLNLIITTGDRRRLLGGEEGERQVISVQKSVITDYKAGRLTLDAFRQKVLQYKN